MGCSLSWLASTKPFFPSPVVTLWKLLSFAGPFEVTLALQLSLVMGAAPFLGNLRSGTSPGSNLTNISAPGSAANDDSERHATTKSPRIAEA